MLLGGMAETLYGRSLMAAASAAGRLPQSITRRIGTPSNY
jgi:hypothetical protein